MGFQEFPPVRAALMADTRRQFEPSLVDPVLAAMDVDTSPPGHDAIHEAEVALPPNRQGVALNVVPPRPIVLSEQNHAGNMPTLTADASSSARIAHAPAAVTTRTSSLFPTASWAAGGDNSVARWSQSQRELFREAYPRYLRMTGQSWPTDAQLTVNGRVISLENILVRLGVWIGEIKRLNPRLQLTSAQLIGDGLAPGDWQVIARGVVPGAPRCGLFRGSSKTTKPIGKAVCDIFHRHLLGYRVNRLVVEVTDNMPAHHTSTTSNTTSESARPAASAVPARLNALAPAPEPISRVSNIAVPTSWQTLYTQFFELEFGKYLHSNGLALPTEAERTVGGKVIDLPQLLWFMNGCGVQLGRLLTAGDVAGLAVAHFNFPPHKHYFLGERDWRSFWGSTPEVADGLIELYNKHLRPLHEHLVATKANWQPALIARANEIGFAPAGIESMQFIQATDIAMDVKGESPAARAIGIIADERPGVTGAADKSLSAQKHFALTLGFSPFVDIMKRVFKRIAEVKPNEIGGERFKAPDLLGTEATKWVEEWEVFSRHHERALIIGAKHIHETLKNDSDSEKLLFMMAAYDSMHLAGGLSAPTAQDIYAARLGFPPRPNVNVGTLLAWNADYGHIWAKFDRVAGPRSWKVLYPLAPTSGAKVPPMMVDVREHRPKSNHKLHAEKVVRGLTSLRKSSTWIQPPAGFKPVV